MYILFHHLTWVNLTENTFDSLAYQMLIRIGEQNEYDMINNIFVLKSRLKNTFRSAWRAAI